MKEGGKGKKIRKEGRRKKEIHLFSYTSGHFKRKNTSLNGNKHDPDGSLGKECNCNAGDMGQMLGWEESMATNSSVLA